GPVVLSRVLGSRPRERARRGETSFSSALLASGFARPFLNPYEGSGESLRRSSPKWAKFRKKLGKNYGNCRRKIIPADVNSGSVLPRILSRISTSFSGRRRSRKSPAPDPLFAEVCRDAGNPTARLVNAGNHESSGQTAAEWSQRQNV